MPERLVMDKRVNSSALVGCMPTVAFSFGNVKPHLWREEGKRLKRWLVYTERCKTPRSREISFFVESR